MAIKLRVISDHYRQLGEQRSRVFGVNGGTIGRAPDNDWVLPDPTRVVSGHHCEIEYRGGAYWVRDLSTNGVFVNDSEIPVAETGPVALQDGDRLRVGDFEMIVSVDARIDFLPAASEEHSAAKHLDHHIGADLNLDSLFAPRDPDESGSISVRNAFGIKVPTDMRRILETPAARTDSAAVPAEAARTDPPDDSPSGVRRAPAPTPPEWAMRTHAVTREELAEARARRQSRIQARLQAQPLHQQASTWTDLRSAVQAFCRGAGIDQSALSAEAQSMLPLIAGQLLREAVVGLNSVAQARALSTPAASASPLPGSNPLRSFTSVEQALVRLFESHGRLYGGPVDALRDVLQEAKDHEAAVQAGMQAGIEATLGQLAPGNVADQFEQGRARTLPPGQDPRPKYWEHYAEFYRVITQHRSNGLPHPFAEAFGEAYTKKREELRASRHSRDDD